MNRTGKAILIAGVTALVASSFLMILLTLVQLGVFAPDIDDRIALTVASDSAEKSYDGTTLTCDRWYIAGGKLREGDTIDVSVYGQQLTAGESPNSLWVKIRDSRGRDASDFYELRVAPGRLIVSPIHVGLYAYGSKKIYDGSPLRCDRYEMVSGSLQKGHRMEVRPVGQQTFVGSTPATVLAQVFDASGSDVTENYEFHVVSEDLVIVPRPLSIRTGSAEKEFDETPLFCPEWAIEDGEVVAGDTLEVGMGAQLSVPGVIPNRPDFVRITNGAGTDVTDCYQITVKSGTLTVRKTDPEAVA